MSHAGFIHRPPDIDVRRAVHVKLLPDTHAALRLLCIQRGISMQEFIEEMAQRAINNDPLIQDIVDELVTTKKERYYKQLSRTDAESLYDLIEFESPLTK